MNTKNIVFVLLIWAISASAILAQGHKIELTLKGHENEQIIMGHYFNKNMYPDDTITLNKNGYGAFEAKKPLPGGMYIAFLPTRRIFEFMVSDDQYFAMQTDTTDLIGNMKITGSEENSTFFDFQVFRNQSMQKSAALKEQAKAETDTHKKDQLNTQSRELENGVNTKINTIIETKPQLFFAKFLNAAKEVEIPRAPTDENGKVIDPDFRRNYYVAHYFDNFDLSDGRLLRTPIYDGRVKTYITKVVPQMPDSLIAAVDMLISKSKSSDELFRYMVASLYNHFNQSKLMGMDELLVHIIEKYYLSGDAYWASEKSRKEMQEIVVLKKPNLIGSVIRNNTFQRVTDDEFINGAENPEMLPAIMGNDYSLYSVKAKNTILIFWEADCSHCKKALPDLGSRYERLKKRDVEVFAVHMLGGDEGRKKWFDFTNKHELYGWVNCWSPYSYDYKVKYDIRSSPVVYLLDENKEIIAKRVGVPQAEGLILEREFRTMIVDSEIEERLGFAKKFINTFESAEGLNVAKEFIFNYFGTADKKALETYISSYEETKGFKAE